MAKLKRRGSPKAEPGSGKVKPDGGTESDCASDMEDSSRAHRPDKP